jgi:HEAT repeat protein
VKEVFSDDASLWDWVLKLGWLNRIGLPSPTEPDADREVYAFFHPTFQEYFAALAVDDWHFFLHHVPENPDDGVYRAFEPQWKQVILLWLGHEDVAKEKKEAFVEALVTFEDGCGCWQDKAEIELGVYEYRAYFLAAAGIDEFRDCQLSESIVSQLIRWGFGWNEEPQQWRIFPDPIKSRARGALLKSDRKQVLSKLTELIRDMELLCSTTNHRTFKDAVLTLAEIGDGDPEVLSTLLDLIKTTIHDSVRKEAVWSLEQISYSDPQAQSILIELAQKFTKTSTNTYNDWFAAWLATRSLGNIGTDKDKGIQALISLCKANDKDIRQQAAVSLGKIDISQSQKNQAKVIAALVNLCKDSNESEDVREKAAVSLGKHDAKNPEAILPCEDEDRDETIYEPSNAIPENVIRRDSDKEICKQISEKIGNNPSKDNPEAVDVLIELACSVEENIHIRMRAIEKLGEINTSHLEAVNVLVELSRSFDERIYKRAIESLGKIGVNIPQTSISKVKTVLLELVQSVDNKDTCRQAAESLGRIDPDNLEAVKALTDLLKHTVDSRQIYRNVAKSLRKILKIEKSMQQAVIELRDILSDESSQKNPVRFEKCYKIIWKCAQNLSYPDFYRAWHSPTNSISSPETT